MIDTKITITNELAIKVGELAKSHSPDISVSIAYDDEYPKQEWLVELDAGYGTTTYVVNDETGEYRLAGLGESIKRRRELGMTTTQPEPGCYFDSHRGHYIYPEIIRLAESFGRQLDEQMAKLVADYDGCHWKGNYPAELVIEESEAAIQWLNEHRCPDNYYWEWYEGDFGLYPLEEEG